MQKCKQKILLLHTTLTQEFALQCCCLLLFPSKIIMGLHSRPNYSRSSSTRYVPLIVLLCLAALIFIGVDNLVLQTKTIVGHNLEPTPWHTFPAKNFTDESTYTKASRIIQCSYLSCGSSSEKDITIPNKSQSRLPVGNCPEFYKWIHQDLSPWSQSRISLEHVMKAQNYSAFRVVIVREKLYVDFYFACVQSRAMFTIWGILQLIRRYPGKVPDVDLMFDCMDKPTIERQEHQSMPLPLFRYCTTPNHFDIPFPDWSFWGWPEVNIRPWDEEFKSIKKGSLGRSWRNKWPVAYWKGNPDVVSPIRSELIKCNHSRTYRAQIMKQDWETEVKEGFQNSQLSKQCDHRYKIYAEGYAWSVSLKYILSCGSLPLLIHPEYQDFFSRGLFPKENYWPITPNTLCLSIKFAVDWGNANPREAFQMGKASQDFMKSLDMDRIYDYMLHLITEYSKLLDYEPIPPASAKEVCVESSLCYADEEQRKFLEMSASSPSPDPPCTLSPPDPGFIQGWLDRKNKIIAEIESFVQPIE